MKIVFTGGGTGGHIFPIIAIAREIIKISTQRGIKDIQLFYIGPKDEFSGLFLPHEGIKVKNILAGKFRRDIDLKSIVLNFFDFLKIPFGFFQSLFYFFWEGPDLVFGKGGFGSFPALLSAKILQIPIFLHESDIYPGKVNQIFGKFAIKIFASFPKTEYFDLQKMIVVGNPIREEMLDGSKEHARYIFSLTGEKPVVLILGGSRGARKINDLMLLILSNILKDFEVLHQTGYMNFKEVKEQSRVVIPEGLEKYYHIFPFLKEDELKHAYKAADIIVSRAGSGSIFEIAALSKPSILIPLANSAQNHQVRNAYAFSQTEAAMVIEETNLTPNFFLERLKFLISRPEELEKMKISAKNFAKPEAAKIIANYLIEYLTQS